MPEGGKGALDTPSPQFDQALRHKDPLRWEGMVADEAQLHTALYFGFSFLALAEGMEEWGVEEAAVRQLAQTKQTVISFCTGVEKYSSAFSYSHIFPFLSLLHFSTYSVYLYNKFQQHSSSKGFK